MLCATIARFSSSSATSQARPYRDHDLVFCDEIGRPIYPETVSGWFVSRRTAADVPVGSLHVLRHTHATIALTEGVPLHVVATARR